MNKFIRRDIPLALIAWVLSGCSGDNPTVIVVGSGLSGHAAAYNALAEGADVRWIEKNETLGGSAVIASGTFSAPGTRLQKEKGIEDSVEDFMADMDRIGKGRADRDIMRTYAETSTEVWEWLVDNGLEPSERSPFIDPVHSPYSIKRTYTPVKNSAFEYCRLYQDRMKKYKKHLTTMTSTEVVSLIREVGIVTGVTCSDGNEYRADSVILCTGGFGSNHDFIAERMPEYKELMTVSMPQSTGSGLIMAEEIGAQLVNMDYLVAYFGAISQKDTKAASFSTLTSGFADRWHGDIWVGRDGNRFINEDGFDEDPRETAIDDLPDQTSYIIFDQGMIEANDGKTPLRNFEELVAENFGVRKADSLEELAEAFHINYGNLEKTIEKVNLAAETGVDEEFGREINMPLNKAPYYCIEARGTIFLTQGGVKVNTTSQAIDREGRVIPGLYAAGEVIGSVQWSGKGYSGGAGTTGALVFGTIAGKNAVISRK